MGAGQGGGAGVEGLAVDAVGPPEGPAALEGARGRAGQEPVAVAARAWRRGGRRSRRRRRAAAVTATSSGPRPLRRRARSVGRLAARSRSSPPGRGRGRRCRCGRRRSARPARAGPSPAPSPARPAPCAGPAAAPSRGTRCRRIRCRAGPWPRRSMHRERREAPRHLESPVDARPAHQRRRHLGPGPAGRPPGAASSSTASSVDVIAPDSNRSATARSITTRSPLTVEEVEFEDGDVGYATDGTPVDCVRFAELGLVGGRPDLIVSGINHGANLGDDITYSGTVAAALRGDRPRDPGGRPLPAVLRRRHGLRQRPLRLRRRRRLHRPAGLAPASRSRCREATLINVNCPAGEPDRDRGDEARQTDLQRRAEAGRRGVGPAAAATRSTAGSPATRRSRGPTSTRSRAGRISVTPIHFDLTDHGGLERLRGWGFEEMLAASAPAA